MPPAQALLADVREIVAEGRWTELEAGLQRIRGSPNNSEANLRDAAYSAPSASGSFGTVAASRRANKHATRGTSKHTMHWQGSTGLSQSKVWGLVLL
jgi:hypothetical protein